MHLTIEVADHIANKIIEDLTDRCGLGNAWDTCDEETQQVIHDAWMHIIESLGG